MAELDILCDDQRDLEDVVAAAQRDVTAEHLFLAAALLLLKTSDVAISDLTIPADSDTEHPGVPKMNLHGRRHGPGDPPAFAWVPRKGGFRRPSDGNEKGLEPSTQCHVRGPSWLVKQKNI